MIVCPICNFELNDPLIIERYHTEFGGEDLSYDIYRCDNCEVEFCSPMKAAPAGWYEEKQSYPWRWEFDKAINDIGNAKKTILEIGCGPGHLIEKLGSLGHEVYGIEINEIAIIEAKTRDLKVLNLQIEEYCSHFGRNFFDIIIFFHVLEHLEKPIEFLNEINKLLTLDGRILFSVPNPNRIHRLLNIYPPYERPPHHLIRNFSLKGIKIAMEKNGFDFLSSINQPTSSIWLTFRETIAFYFSDLGITLNKRSRLLSVLIKLPTILFFPFFFFKCWKVRNKSTGLAIYLIAKKNHSFK